MELNHQNRIDFLQKATKIEWDLCIIGGGVTGAGIFLDAQSRGLKVLLLEQKDFASGTSGKSTKLIHGGLRYLKNFEFGLVKEVGSERKIVYENAPHVTRPEPMLLPLVKNGTLGVWGATVGLWIYDWLAGVAKKERRRMVRKPSVLAMEPGLNEDRVVGGAWYFEYRTDDARLTLELINAGKKLGGEAHPYANVISIQKDKLFAVTFRDEKYGEEYSVSSKALVNATGPWIDNVIRFSDANAEPRLLLSQGIHVVVDASKMPIGQAMYFDTSDRRMIFAIPRDGKVYIGTTEHVVSLEDAERVKIEHVQYLLDSVMSMFPAYTLKRADVESVWAGVRPLILEKGKKPGEVSRKDELFFHENGMLSIAGGKLTGYRKMAERTTDAVMKQLHKSVVCKTDTIRLYEGDWDHTSIVTKIDQWVASAQLEGLSENVARTWAWRYGKRAEEILVIWNSKKTEANSECIAELEFGIQNEMVMSTMDYLIRRTSYYYFNAEFAQQNKEIIHRYLATRLSWNKNQIDQDLMEINEYFSRIDLIRNS